MSGFSSEWLTLREKADLAARSPVVLDRARESVSSAIRDGMTICDLGAGTGASIDAFSDLFEEPLSWQLVDVDAGNLALAQERLERFSPAREIALQTKIHNLAADPAPWDRSANLVTATALFDLTSADWLRRFTACLARDRLPLLATLTYDGRLELAPEHPLDGIMIDAFNAHQRTDKGFGPAAGPDAIETLERDLARHGFDVLVGDSPWLLNSKDDRILIDTLLDGWAASAQEIGLLTDEDVFKWLNDRKAATSTFVVGHRDLFASPAQ